MILGLGTDIADMRRIEGIVRKHAEHFLERLLTPREIAESEGCISYIAGRWAAKEALSKALGCGIGAKCSFTDIEILRDPLSGRPLLSLSGNARNTADSVGVKNAFLSISHEKHYAVATVVLEG